MKPFIDFKYEPHDHKAEDKRIRDFRAEHDPNDSALTNWNLFVFVTTLITGGILATALVYLAHAYRRNIFAFFRWLDELPMGAYLIFTLACIAAIFIFWRGRKDRRNI